MSAEDYDAHSSKRLSTAQCHFFLGPWVGGVAATTIDRSHSAGSLFSQAFGFEFDLNYSQPWLWFPVTSLELFPTRTISFFAELIRSQYLAKPIGLGP